MYKVMKRDGKEVKFDLAKIGIAIRKAFETVKGSIIMRGKTEIDRMPNGKGRIIITEIPYQVNKSRLIQKIAEYVKDKKSIWVRRISSCHVYGSFGCYYR